MGIASMYRGFCARFIYPCSSSYPGDVGEAGVCDVQAPSRPTRARTGTRRSTRLALRVPVLVYEARTDKRFFVEESFSLTVNKHGALIALRANVNRGQKLVLANKNTRSCKECRIIYLGPKQFGKKLVGVEFTQPAPDFWSISFPSSDSKSVPE